MTTTDHLAADVRALATLAARTALQHARDGLGWQVGPQAAAVLDGLIAGIVARTVNAIVDTVDLHGGVAPAVDHRTSPARGVIAPEGLAGIAARDATP